jgi:hypothetical protein
MKKQLLILFLLAFSSLAGHAQYAKTPQPDSVIKIIPIGEGKYTGYAYTIGGKLYTRQDVVLRLLNYAPSASEYNLAKNNVTWGFVLFTVGGLAGIGAIFEFAHDNKMNGATFNPDGNGFIYQQHNKTGAYILTGAAVGLLTAGIITVVSGSKHGKKALWLYNQRFQ